MHSGNLRVAAGRALARAATPLSLVLGGVLLYACWDKLLHPEAFAAAVRAYRLLPEAFSNLPAIWLPWLELVLGLCLVSGIWREGALGVSCALLAVFWGILWVSFARGLNVDCGCFSAAADPAEAEGASMLWYLGRDALLLALALGAWEAQRLRRKAAETPAAPAGEGA